MPTATIIDAFQSFLANKLWSPSDAMIVTRKILKKRDREVDLSILVFWLQLPGRRAWKKSAEYMWVGSGVQRKAPDIHGFSHGSFHLKLPTVNPEIFWYRWNRLGLLCKVRSKNLRVKSF